MIDFIHESTFWIIVLGSGLLGATSGILGSFAVLKNQSLLGDAISHAALPGIVLAFLFTGIKSSSVLMMGAILCGLLGAFLVNDIVKYTKLKTDAALGVILSVFFGVGMMLLTYVQGLDNSNQAGLDRYLFGQAATLLKEDLYLMLAFLIPSIAVIYLLWKEFKVTLFDGDYAETLGISSRLVNSIIMLLIVINIVMGLQTVGVVLMSSLLLSPAAAARQWTNSLKKMLLIAAIIGLISGVSGAWISATQSNLPTGPVITLVASVFVVVSLLFSPHRGIIAMHIENQRKKKEILND
ncbi:iron chelate uptake ABC transporter family permease subunit [Flavobacteriaceae bacterium Ap0902]|nr:iron chelate uptake ABC transporter family permease subunit [Flavobacteriaceae bacterium Ap0902]